MADAQNILTKLYVSGNISQRFFYYLRQQLC